MNRYEALKMAANVLEDRQKRYGNPNYHWKTVSALWSLFVGVTISPRTACQMMTMLKLIRDTHRPDNDNIVDAIGYAALAAEVTPKEEQVEPADPEPPEEKPRFPRNMGGGNTGAAAAVRKAMRAALESVPGHSLRDSDMRGMVYSWLRLHEPKISNRYNQRRWRNARAALYSSCLKWKNNGIVKSQLNGEV